MWGTLKTFLSANAVKLAGYLLAGLSVLGTLLAARKAGHDAAKSEILENTVELKNAQQEAAAAAPRDRDDLLNELRRKDF